MVYVKHLNNYSIGLCNKYKIYLSITLIPVYGVYDFDEYILTYQRSFCSYFVRFAYSCLQCYFFSRRILRPWKDPVRDMSPKTRANVMRMGVHAYIKLQITISIIKWDETYNVFHNNSDVCNSNLALFMRIC